MSTEIKKITEQLDAMKSDIEYIKEHMIDADSILSKEEEDSLIKARDEFRKGETISLDNLKKQLKL